MALDDVYQIKFVTSCQPGLFNLSVALNILHYRVAAITGSGATELEVVQAYDNAVAPPFKLLLSSDSLYRGAIIQKIFPLPVTDASGTVTNAGAGARIGSLMPLYTCGAVTKLTGLAGRRFRGRIYMPYPLEDDNDVFGKPIAAYVALVNPVHAEMLTPRTVGAVGNQSSVIPVLFHPPPLPPPQTTTVVSGLTRQYWTSQRRRQNSFKADTPPIIV